MSTIDETICLHLNIEYMLFCVHSDHLLQFNILFHLIIIHVEEFLFRTPRLDTHFQSLEVPLSSLESAFSPLIEQGMNLKTNFPVLAATGLPSDQWPIMTSRDTLQASKIILIATNAYTAGIVPLLNNKIVPVRGTVYRILSSIN